MPLVSVIIPVYNREQLLREAIESAAAQTFTDYEIIIVDDGSTDDTHRAIDDLVKTCTDGIRLIRQDHTGMPGQVRNRGAREASGDYIAFLDSDDLWKPEKLRKQVDFMTRDMPAGEGRSELPDRDCRICHTREIWLRMEKEISQKGQRHRREGMIFSDALKKCIIGPSTVMMERSLFDDTGGFREDIEIAEDYEYWLRICGEHEIGYINEALVVKRAGEWEQLSEKYGHIEFFRLKGLKDLVDRDYFFGENRRKAAAELAEKCRIYAAGCRKRGRTDEAAEYESAAEKYLNL